MSPEPSRRSVDLDWLRREGFDVAVADGLLVVRQVPYVTRNGSVGLGTIKVPVRMAGDATLPPDSHTIRWVGEMPCSATGQPIAELTVSSRHFKGTGEILLCHRPFDREFHDYHELVTSYVNLLGGHAVLVDPLSTARIGGVAEERNQASPFHYIDTATGRAGTENLTRRLEGISIAIVGLGGTGSYILDLVAKTPVATIHLFDDDTFDQHNAFRAPGAASLEELAMRRAKVDHFAGIYSRLHRGIVPHRERMEKGALKVLDDLDFAFVCIDEVASKKAICGRLTRKGVTFIDTGIGLEVAQDGIFGLVRTTTSTHGAQDLALECIPGGLGGTNDPYASNVQVADLNALNAALAVVRWKRHFGFYRNRGEEHQSVYEVDTGRIYEATRQPE